MGALRAGAECRRAASDHAPRPRPAGTSGSPESPKPRTPGSRTSEFPVSRASMIPGLRISETFVFGPSSPGLRASSFRFRFRFQPPGFRFRASSFRFRASGPPGLRASGPPGMVYTVGAAGTSNARAGHPRLPDSRADPPCPVTHPSLHPAGSLHGSDERVDEGIVGMGVGRGCRDGIVTRPGFVPDSKPQSSTGARMPGLLLNRTALGKVWGSSPGPVNRRGLHSPVMIARARRLYSPGLSGRARRAHG